MIGLSVGNWKLVRLLGEGAFGAVYEAENNVVKSKRAAVKLLHPTFSVRPDIRVRFLNEASAASQAEHENIVQIFDAGTTDHGQCYLAMELLRGTTLSQAVRDGAIGVERTIGIGLQTANALQAAHDLRIVHRDLKPDNIFLVRRSSTSDFVKVLDFGIAKLHCAGEGQQAMRTEQGVLLGTPAYMAPEQWMSAPDVDGRADIYALGMILFQCLTGQLPFSAKNHYEWLLAHVEQPVPNLATITPVPQWLAELVHAMLAKERLLRPQTMLEVAARLEAARTQVTTSATGRRTVLAVDGGVSAMGRPVRDSASFASVVTTTGERKPLTSVHGHPALGPPAQAAGLAAIDMGMSNPVTSMVTECTPSLPTTGNAVDANMAVRESRAQAPTVLTPVLSPQASPSPNASLASAKGPGIPTPNANRNVRRRSAVWVLLVFTVVLAAAGGLVALQWHREQQARLALEARAAQLTREADAALAQRDWDTAIRVCDESVAEASAAARLRICKVRAEDERRNRALAERIRAVMKSDPGTAAQLLADLSGPSVYRGELTVALKAATTEWIGSRLQAAHAMPPEECSRAVELAREVLAVDASNEGATQIIATCNAPAAAKGDHGSHRSARVTHGSAAVAPLPPAAAPDPTAESLDPSEKRMLRRELRDPFTR